MTLTLTPEYEADIKRQGAALFVERMREAGLGGRTLGSLSPTERATFDRAGSDMEKLEAELRENGGPLLVLDGVPRPDGTTPVVFDPPDDGKLIALDGVPMVDGYDHAAASLEFSAMREAQGADDGDSAELIDLGPHVPRVRESSFGGDDFGTPEIYVEGPDTLALLQDLFTVLPEHLPTGSMNLENEIVKTMIQDVQNGHALAPAALGKLKDMLVKYAPAVKALRASKDKKGQDYAAVPDPSTGRTVTDDDRAAGLLDLGPTVPKAAA